MKNQKQTVRKIVGFLNDADEDGGFWLPNIQRPFVWREEQICPIVRLDPARISDQHTSRLEDYEQNSPPEVHRQLEGHVALE